MEEIHRSEWGAGRPVLALHPLGLDGGAFEGIAQVLMGHGFRTIAVDLPGFGRTPYPREPLTPARLARPVIRLAQELASVGKPPVVIGISLGGRVALECALEAPEVFREVIAIAPYLPWLRYRELLRLGRILSPEAAERLHLERLWPVLRPLAYGLEHIPHLRDDQVAQAGARLVYFLSCPATRAAFVSAARELALDKAFGEEGFWTRLPTLPMPASFLWGGRDHLVTSRFSERVAKSLPEARQRLLPCAGHALNGPHHRCVAHALALLLCNADDGSERMACSVGEPPIKLLREAPSSAQ